MHFFLLIFRTLWLCLVSLELQQHQGEATFLETLFKLYGEECNIPKRPGWSEFIGI